MKYSQVYVWLPSMFLLGSIVLLGILWLVGMFPQLYDVRRDLLDGFIIASSVIVIISSLLIGCVKRSWIALLPVVVIVATFVLRKTHQHDQKKLEEIGRLQVQAYATERFGIKFKDGKMLPIDDKW